MTDKDAEILKALTRGDTSGITDTWLRHMKESYPFFPLTEVMALRDRGTAMTESSRREAISRIALALGGGGTAAEAIMEPDMDSEPFYPPEEAPSRPSTENTIEKFLQTYGNAEDSETATLEKLIFNPVADYSQQLAREAGEMPGTPDPEGDSQDDRINRFILSMNRSATEGEEETVPLELPEPPRKTPPAQKAQHKEKKSGATPLAKVPEQPADNSLLSESLAKIYIKTKRYERAYEILSRLSLAFPEKNAYFADQLRFLRKLMLAESYRKKRIENQNDSEK